MPSGLQSRKQNVGLTNWSSKTKQEKHGKIHHRSIQRICSKPATKWHLQLYLQNSVLMKQHTLQEATYQQRIASWGVSCKAQKNDVDKQELTYQKRLCIKQLIASWGVSCKIVSDVSNIGNQKLFIQLFFSRSDYKTNNRTEHQDFTEQHRFYDK